MKKTTRTITKDVYSKKCPHCNKEIRGFSKSACEYNFNVHVQQKHKSRAINRIEKSPVEPDTQK